MLTPGLSATEIEKIEGLIATTDQNRINPNKFIPWATEPTDNFDYMPLHLVSLYGHPLYGTLTTDQKRELAKAEVGQVMYSYAWSEALACLFFYRYLATLPNSVSAEYRYLLIMIFEETCHQQMFSRGIQRLNFRTAPPRRLHRRVGDWAARFLPADVLFMSVLAIEMVTDMYGREIMKFPNMYPVLAKISELHKIEEDRHMYFGELILKRYTDNASLLRRTFYSIIVCMNLYFMRTLYVRKNILQRIGLDPNVYYQPAYSGLKQKFGAYCLSRATDFVASWHGFNWFTRLIWRTVLAAKV